MPEKMQSGNRETEEPWTVALVQMTSSRDMSDNIRRASDFIRRAAASGADFVSTPETTHLMEMDRERLLATACRQQEDPGVRAFCALAQELGIWLHIGSLIIRTEREKLANRSFLIGPNGRIAATYDKLHLFDVTLPDGETYRESALYRAGTHAVVFPNENGKSNDRNEEWHEATNLPCPVGLSICYDLRFPHLYRTLAKAGAGILLAPSAFTVKTGQAHWHILLRARAIETGSFMLAAAQTGLHETGRRTYGHSLIISPWGEVLQDAGEEETVLIQSLDLREIVAARHTVPSLRADRPFTI